MPVGVVKTGKDERVWQHAVDAAKEKFGKKPKKGTKGKKSSRFWRYAMGSFKQGKGLSEMAMIDESISLSQWLESETQ